MALAGPPYDPGMFPASRPTALRYGAFLLLLPLVAGCGGAPDPAEPPVVAEVEALIETALAEWPTPAISVGIQHNGEILLARGYGFADLENRVPATAHTVYRIGSVTKQFTGAAIMLLAEDGLLDVEEDFRTYLPDYDTQGFSIPVERLLNHTSGIKGYTEMPEFWEQARLDLSPEEMIELFGSVPFEFEPGDDTQYSNSAFYLLGLIIERLSGSTYSAFLGERLFEPLGLTETHYLDNEPIIRNRASGYEVDEGAFVNAEPISMRLPYSAGSLGASVLDLLAWQRALTGGEAVSAESYAAMSREGELTSGEPVARGYGLRLGEEHGARKVEHGGGINGFRAQLAWYPEEELGIAVLTNSGAGRPQILENRIALVVLGRAQPEIVEIPANLETLSRFAGTYDAGRSPAEVRLEDGSLRGLGGRLVPVGEAVFHPEGDPFTRVEFERAGEAPASAMVVINTGVRSRAPRVPE